MIFNIVHPFMLPIHAVSLNEGIKDFVKIHRFLEINDLIIQDRDKMFKANMKYLKNDGRNKVGLDIVPYSGPLIQVPTYQQFVQTYFPMYPYFQTGGVGITTSYPSNQRSISIIPNYGIYNNRVILRLTDFDKPEFKGAEFKFPEKNEPGTIKMSTDDFENFLTLFIEANRNDDEKKTIAEKKEKVEKLEKDLETKNEELKSLNSANPKNEDDINAKKSEIEEIEKQIAVEKKESAALTSTIPISVMKDFFKKYFNKDETVIPKEFTDHYHRLSLSSLPEKMPVTHYHSIDGKAPVLHTHKKLNGYIRNLQARAPFIPIPFSFN